MPTVSYYILNYLRKSFGPPDLFLTITPSEKETIPLASSSATVIAVASAHEPWALIVD